MLIALTILMAAAALFLVAWPILGRKAQSKELGTGVSSLESLLGRRDAVFQALRDLSFDHQVGKVSDNDHVVFEASLRETAAEVLRAIDEWEESADQLLGEELGQPAGAAPAVAGAGTRPCPACGHPATMDDQFCARCGKRLPEPKPPVSKRCPQCGLGVAPEDKFCAGCGAQVG